MGPYQTEKDYIQDLLLHGMYSTAREDLVFKGGTALSKFYYSDRFSEDIDFTYRDTTESAAKIDFESTLSEALKSIAYETEYKQKPKINEFGTIEAVLSVGGPRFNGRRDTVQYVRIEASIRGSVILAPKPLSRAPVYADAPNYVALVMDKAEMLAEKIRAILSRGRLHKERDLYDICFFAF